MARRSQGRRSDYVWNGLGDVELSQDVGANAGVLGSAILTPLTPLTVVRIRGRIGCYLDSSAGDESAMIVCGITILSPDAVAAPEPFTSGVADEGSWIWQGALYMHSGVGVAAGNEEAQVDRIDVDTKAMRKMKPLEQLVFVHQASVALVQDQSGTYDLTWYLHILTAE